MGQKTRSNKDKEWYHFSSGRAWSHSRNASACSFEWNFGKKILNEGKRPIDIQNDENIEFYYERQHLPNANNVLIRLVEKNTWKTLSQIVTNSILHCSIKSNSEPSVTFAVNSRWPRFLSDQLAPSRSLFVIIYCCVRNFRYVTARFLGGSMQKTPPQIPFLFDLNGHSNKNEHAQLGTPNWG